MSNELNRIVKDLERGIQVDMNLSRYGGQMMTLCYRLSGVQLAFHYPLLYEMTEGKNLSGPYREHLDNLRQLIDRYLLGDFSGQMLEQGVMEMDALRNQVIEAVQALTEYADCFRIYEYVLNRLEYRFRDSGHIRQTEDQEFAEELLQFALSGEDAQLKNLRLQEIVAQLPVRMTRAKFYHLLGNALSIYQGAEKQSLEDFLYLLRSGCLLEKGENVFPDPELQEIREALEQADYVHMTGEAFERLSGLLQIGTEKLTGLTDLYLTLTEVVNACYAVLLSAPYAMGPVQEQKHCRAVLKQVQEGFFQPEFHTLDDGFEEHFRYLEGLQERLLEQYETAVGGISVAKEHYQDLLSGLMLEKIFGSLDRIMLLLSGSQFVSLTEKKEEGEVDSACLKEELERLKKAFDGLFDKSPKCVQRAVMAEALGLIPVFFEETAEIMAYFEGSLSSCRDEAEKAACRELLQNMMGEDDEMV